jgi:HSP20 family protein
MKLAPFRSAMTLQRELDRIFNDWSDRAVDWHPVMDVLEEGDTYLVKVELPGVKAEDVKIKLENNVLTLSGTKIRSEEDEAQHYFRNERVYGSFERSIKIPSTVDANLITATCKDGILTVEVPKAEKAKPREIPITSA